MNLIDFSKFVLMGSFIPRVEVLVMDEGDKLFEEGFIEQIDTILTACTNPHLQRLLFSATLPQVLTIYLIHI